LAALLGRKTPLRHKLLSSKQEVALNAIALRPISAGFPARLISRFRAWMDEPVGFDATAPSPIYGRDWADLPVQHPQFAQLAPEPIGAAEHLCGTVAFLRMSTNAAGTAP
jgi:hypothetical protein